MPPPSSYGKQSHLIDAGFSLGLFSTLKMELACSFETLVDFQRTTRCIPEDRALHTHRSENLKSWRMLRCFYKNRSVFACLGCLSTQSVQVRGPLWHFIIILLFYGEELLVSCPTPQLEDHPLSTVRDYLFNIFAAILHMWRYRHGTNWIVLAQDMNQWRVLLNTVINLRVL
jgi:hypothetical protein